jgi:hypothetical protein
MDLRQFVPRYTSETAVKFCSGDFSRTSPPRARHLPLRSAPPIIPARNPLRVGKAPRPLETVAKIWDPEVGNFVARQPSGGSAHIIETSAQLGNRIIQRSISTNTFQHRAFLISASDQRSGLGRSLHEEIQRSISTNTVQRGSLQVSAGDQRSTFGRLLHKEVEQLRQSFIELQNDDDDVFAPTTPPRRSASSATLRTLTARRTSSSRQSDLCAASDRGASILDLSRRRASCPIILCDGKVFRSLPWLVMQRPSISPRLPLHKL